MFDSAIKEHIVDAHPIANQSYSPCLSRRPVGPQCACFGVGLMLSQDLVSLHNESEPDCINYRHSKLRAMRSADSQIASLVWNCSTCCKDPRQEKSAAFLRLPSEHWGKLM
jgi:hypothetical protein